MENRLNTPVYIISKGRFEKTYTADIFLAEDIPFFMVVEPQEYDLYKSKIPEKYLIRLPFSNLGLGSYPARNYCWEDSIKRGYNSHFLFDDNILFFMTWLNNKRVKAKAKDCLKIAEDLFIKYSNIGIVGFEEPNFVVRFPNKPFKINCHVYSAMLINNNIPYRWRLKYNEDVDLNLQILHNKLCTISLIWYMANKNTTTVKQKGGNQSELYQGNSPLKKQLKSKSLEMIWPKYVKTVIRYGRPHHYINWGKYFNHPLIRKVA
jgi:hypothetical protein